MKSVARILKKVADRISPNEARLQVEDMYIDYLRYATPGMCDPGNVYAFEYVFKNVQGDLPMLEIGSWCGQSANIMMHLLGRQGRSNVLFTCDGWKYEAAEHPEHLGNSQLSYEKFYSFVKETYIRNTRFFSGERLPHSLHMVSDDFFVEWRAGQTREDVFGRPAKLGGDFCFCFIDGDHAYEPAQRDFENCDAHLCEGGMILFDDSEDGGGWPGVQQVVAEVLATGRYEIVMKNPHYLLRKT